jgi:hypothetical protein
VNVARSWVLWLGLSLVPGACSSQSTADKPICNSFQFRACKAACGRGVQQCAASGLRWGRCACVVVDASFEVSLPDGGADAADASLDGASDETAADAPSDVSEASRDGAPDAPDGSDAPSEAPEAGADR